MAKGRKKKPGITPEQKRILQNEKRRIRNKSALHRMRTDIKKLLAAVEAGDKAKSEELLLVTTKVIDKIKSKGILHKNNASRKISRLTKRVKEASFS